MAQASGSGRAWLYESLILGALYIATGALGHLLATIPPGSATPFWPPAGIVLAAFVLRGTRLWPGVLLGAFVESTRVFLHASDERRVSASLLMGAIISVGCVLEGLVAAYLFRRASLQPHDMLEHVQGVVRFTLLAMFASALGAFFGSTSLLVGSFVSPGDYLETWLTWWLGDTVGMLVVTPLILVFAEKPPRDVRWVEIGAQQVALLAFQVYFVGGALPLSSDHYPLGHLVTPFLVWAGVRLGQQGVVLALFNVSSFATWITVHGMGPFVTNWKNASLLLVQAFICNTAVTTLLLCAVICERTRAQSLLGESRDQLERRVRERTADLAKANAKLLAEVGRRREKERALRESEERYRILVEVNPDAIFATTIGDKASGARLLYANPAAAALLGIDPSALVGVRPARFVPQERRRAIWDHIREAIEHGRIGPFEDRLLRPDGVCIDIEATCAMVPWGGGGRALVVIVRDITRRKQIEEQRAQLYRDAEESIRARDEFLSIASHELKTPLTSLTLKLQGIVRKAQKDPDLGPKIEPGLEVALRQTDRLGALVDDLLDVSRISQGRLKLCLEEVDLMAIVREVALRMQELATRSGCALRLREGAPVVGRWDRARLEQVTLNMLSNAIKYGAGAPIEVEVSAGEAGTTTLSVRDRGIGISAEDQERIFGRFERAVSVSHFGGFGLGLWIAREIVEAHGGRIVVKSAPGEGATFIVTLPRALPGDGA